MDLLPIILQRAAILSRRQAKEAAPAGSEMSVSEEEVIEVHRPKSQHLLLYPLHDLEAVALHSRAAHDHENLWYLISAFRHRRCHE